jgi:hypothetical protein
VIHPITIGGRQVDLEWTQDIASRMPFRASRIGGSPSMADFANPKKAAAAVTSFLWLVLPPAVHQLFSNPEELFVAIDHKTEAAAIHSALVAIVGEMEPDAEKKSTLRKPPSPAPS